MSEKTLVYILCQTSLIAAAVLMVVLYRRLHDPFLFWTEVIRVGVITLTAIITNAYLYSV